MGIKNTTSLSELCELLVGAHCGCQSRPWFGRGRYCCRSLSQEEEAKKLVSEAIAAGIFNDLGSGSNIDLCVISKSKLDFLRPYTVPNKKGTR